MLVGHYSDAMYDNAYSSVPTTSSPCNQSVSTFYSDHLECDFPSLNSANHTRKNITNLGWPFRQTSTEKPAEGSSTDSEFYPEKILDFIEERVQVDRKKLEQMISINPFVKIAGLPEQVAQAKEEILAMLKTRQNRVTLKMDVPFTDHSHIIGRQGRNTQMVMKDTACHIHFPDSNKNSDFEKSNQVSIAGPMKGVEKARQLIRSLAPLSVTFELKNVRREVDVSAWLQNPALEFETGTTDITVLIRPNRSSGQPFVLIRGSVHQENSIRTAYKALIDRLFYPGTEVQCALSLDIMPDQQKSVLGVDNMNMNIISGNTKSLIHYPPSDKKGATTFYVRGTLDGILSARKQVLAFLPICLSFEMTGEPVRDLIALQQTENVVISVKPKRGSDSVKCVTIKTQEWNTTAMYSARDQMLGLVGKTEQVVCTEYDFMNNFHFPPQFAQTSPNELLPAPAPQILRISPASLMVNPASGFVVSPGAVSPVPTVGPVFAAAPHVSPLNGVVMNPMVRAQCHPSLAPAQLNGGSDLVSTLLNKRNEEEDARRRRSQASTASDSSTPKRSVSSTTTVRQLSTSEDVSSAQATNGTGATVAGSATGQNVADSPDETDSPIAKAILDSAGALGSGGSGYWKRAIGAERREKIELNTRAFMARNQEVVGERFPRKDFCGQGLSQSMAPALASLFSNDPSVAAHLVQDLNQIDEVFESEARDELGAWPTNKFRQPPGSQKSRFGASTIERPSDLPHGREGISLVESNEVQNSSPLAALLILHGFAKYIPLFEREEVDIKTFLLLSEDDLKEMEIGLGPRRGLLRLISEKRAEEEKEKEKEE